jgi:hypothetical protein
VILEGLITTINADGTANLAPLGPLVDEALSQFVLRPFQTSTTWANLERTGSAVFHVTDDVELLAQAAIGPVNPPPELVPCPPANGLRLSDCCRWYALRMRSIDASEPRATLIAEVADQGRVRDFFGLNRAKHAVVEAAILATRIHLLGVESILAEYEKLQVLVDKTGGESERRAFARLTDHVRAAGTAST